MHVKYISNTEHQVTVGYFLRSDAAAPLPADSKEALGQMQSPSVCRRRCRQEGRAERGVSALKTIFVV